MRAATMAVSPGGAAREDAPRAPPPAPTLPETWRDAATRAQRAACTGRAQAVLLASEERAARAQLEVAVATYERELAARMAVERRLADANATIAQIYDRVCALVTVRVVARV